jgi:hypothetical protein
VVVAAETAALLPHKLVVVSRRPGPPAEVAGTLAAGMPNVAMDTVQQGATEAAMAAVAAAAAVAALSVVVAAVFVNYAI